jgi:ribosomal protein L32
MVGRVLRPAPDKTDAIILDHAGAVFMHGFPEDEITWFLEEDRPAENKAHSARGQYEAPSLTTCPECSAVRFQGRPCPVCGWHPVAKPKPVEVAEGELGEVGRDRTVGIPQIDRASFHRQLAYIAQERGYKPGWASHQCRERFGKWPRARLVQRMPPDPATRSWVRSRLIAYAKAQAPR